MKKGPCFEHGFCQEGPLLVTMSVKSEIQGKLATREIPMAKYTSVLSQLLRYVPRREFQAIVQCQQGDKGVRSFPSWRQFVALIYGQLTGQHSLRDLVTALNSSLHKLQHVGLRAVRCSTLADANSKRSHEIFRELFFALYGRCCQQAPSHGFQFRHKLYSLDATVIDLRPSLFTWQSVQSRSDLDRLRLVLESLADEELMVKLERQRGRGRDDYPVRAMWNSVLAGIVFEPESIESLRRELSRNGELRV